MPAYLVQAPFEGGQSLKGGSNVLVVFAADATGARSAAKALFDGDSAAMWNAATVTEIKAMADYAGWALRIKVYGTDVDVTVVGEEGDDIDLLAAAAVAALNNTGPIANASYDAGTSTLTIAGADDELGDHLVLVELTPAWGETPIDGFIGTITDGGDAEDPLTVVLPASGTTLSNVVAALRTR